MTHKEQNPKSSKLQSDNLRDIELLGKRRSAIYDTKTRKMLKARKTKNSPRIKSGKQLKTKMQ